MARERKRQTQGADPFPAAIQPMKARQGGLPDDPRGWVAEIKWDGIRAIAFVEPAGMRLQGSGLNDITSLFPEITRPPVDESLVIDGEIVVFDGTGRPDFQSIQKRLGRQRRSMAGSVQGRSRQTPPPETRPAGTSSAHFVAFDLLYRGTRDLRRSPYVERREALEELELARNWRVPAFIKSDFEEALAVTSAKGLEGLMLKRRQSVYASGTRSRDWIKVKNRLRQEFVIAGWLPGQGARTATLGSLLVGYWSGSRLVYAGRVGSGLSGADLDLLRPVLEEFETSQPPFDSTPRLPGARFVEPLLVAEVEFAEWTADGVLRHPVFVGLRADKDVRDVVLETGGPKGVA